MSQRKVENCVHACVCACVSACVRVCDSVHVSGHVSELPLPGERKMLFCLRGKYYFFTSNPTADILTDDSIFLISFYRLPSFSLSLSLARSLSLSSHPSHFAHPSHSTHTSPLPLCLFIAAMGVKVSWLKPAKASINIIPCHQSRYLRFITGL